MSKEEKDTFYPKNRKAWRQWLQKNHATKESIWLVFYKKESGKPSLVWSDAVDEALCFGWIDSKALPYDEEKSLRFFSRRKPKGTWSKINKEKIKRLIADGLMMPAGLETIERAKQNGSWTILDEVEELIIPKDLEKEFKTKRGSKDFFLSLSRSTRKAMLQWIVLAKQAETRQRRISEIASCAGKKTKPRQF